MTLRFTTLSSGSRGNAALVQSSSFGILIDGGIAPKHLEPRLATLGLSLTCIHGMLLTHTHTDHWTDGLLGMLARGGLPLYCHAGHHAVLERNSPAFKRLQAANLVRSFVAHQPFAPCPSLSCVALPIRHDSGATFAFRVEGPTDLFGRRAALAYASDLGTWDAELADRFANVDLLAVEFNHDVEMERRSSRPAFLIARVLGDMGHLSNEQAAALVRAVMARSTPGRLRHVVQLHLSDDCNTPTRARRAAKTILGDLAKSISIQTARQDRPGKPVVLTGDPPAPTQRTPRTRTVVSVAPAPWLPGFEPVE